MIKVKNYLKLDQLIQIDITFELAPSFAIYNYINAYNIGI